MQHTYLRYECADSFGLVTSVGAASSTRAPPSDATLSLLTTASNSSNNNAAASQSSHLLTTAGSHCTLWNTKTGLPSLKLGHADFTGIGTGQALNASQVLCLDVSSSVSPTTNSSSTRVATGWIDGAVRVFDIATADLASSSNNTTTTAFSLVQDSSEEDDGGPTTERPDPLTLNGHAPSPVSSICLEPPTLSSSTMDTTTPTTTNANSRLASGGSDGTVIVWDLIAESGLFRLLGHQGAITQLHFLPRDTVQQGLVSASLDGLVKVWDLQAQVCVQTLANMRGEVWASTLLSLPGSSSGSSSGEEEPRHRLLTGSVDGQVRVWNVLPSARQQEEGDGDADGDVAMKGAGHTNTTKNDTDDNTETNLAETESNNNKDDVCHDMGLLEAPRQHLATSSSKADTSALTTKERVQSIRYSPYSRHVAILQANAKVIHVYSIRSQKEALRKKQRRLKRRQEKHSKKEKDSQEQANSNSKKRGILDDDETDDHHDQDPSQSQQQAYDPEQLRASDEFEYCGAIKASHKVKAFVFCPIPSTTNKQKKASATRILVKVAAALSTNTIEMYSLERDTKQQQQQQQRVVSSIKEANLTPLYGHPTGVRAIALSSNDDIAATVSKGTCKIWKIANRSCLQSVALERPSSTSSTTVVNNNNKATPTYQGLCAVFLPGNTHVVVGTREGHLLILDTAASEIVYWEEKAHDDAIWSIDIFHSKQQHVSSDGGPAFGNTSIVTGSADKMVKFWTLERQGGGDDDEEDSDSDDEVFVPGAPMVVPTRVLEMTDEVVAVKFSTSQFNNERRRMIFVSTLDCTIKVFFEDSLKLFLSMYGHNLPALGVDASDDDTLLVSGSADKTIKLWGLDFGDTHRTLHGHSDSVTDVRFVRGTHNFFSASKDGTVRFGTGIALNSFWS